MDAKFEDDFWNIKDRNLKRPSLACLKADAHTYKTLMLQIGGKIAFDNTGIWIAEKDVANEKFSVFFEKAIQLDVELAIAPEYSCPWEALDQLLSADKFPSDKNLWLIGMQSMQPEKLLAFIADKNQVTWIFDEDLVKEKLKSHKDGFFDPVCKLLNTIDQAGKPHKVIIVQFKNYPFGGSGSDWERDNLILGKTFYVLKNQAAATQLVTLICSDSLKSINFNEVSDETFLVSPLLVVHIQLNQQPFSGNYKEYRNLLFSKGDRDWFKEVICLNWAKGVSYQDKDEIKIFNEKGGSAFYLKSTKLATSDENINENHKLGLYYTSWDAKRAHAYFLNFDEYLFLIENTKPSQVGADPTQLNRTGPKSLGTFRWVGHSWDPVNSRICDGFQQTIDEVEEKEGDLACLSTSENFIDVERIVELSTGHIKSTANWFLPSNITSFKVGDDEINKRIVFTQLVDPPTITERHRKLQGYMILKKGIITVEGNLPKGFEEPELKFIDSIAMPEKYLLNLHSKDGMLNATAIYMGNAPIKDVTNLQKRIVDLFRDSQQGKLVMVWHESAQGRVRYPPELPIPKISENVAASSDKITKKTRP
jgi:hypothetical protein